MHLAHNSQQTSKINKLAEFLGFTPERKLVGQHRPTNLRVRNDLNHHEIAHTKELQRSRYIQIDDEIKDHQKLETRQRAKEARSKTTSIGLNGYAEVRCSPADHKVELTYTKEAVVRERRKKTLQFKQRLLYQLQNLKAIEHKVRLEGKVERWINDNLEQLTSKSLSRKRPQSERLKESESH